MMLMTFPLYLLVTVLQQVQIAMAMVFVHQTTRATVCQVSPDQIVQYVQSVFMEVVILDGVNALKVGLATIVMKGHHAMQEL